LLSYLRGLHTPTYSSPQQRRGDDPDPRDDIHALGVIAYQMLTGKLDSGPGTGAMRALKRMNMADNLAELLPSCTSEDLDERPENAGEFRKKLVELSPSQASGGRRLPVGSEATGSRRPPLARTEPAVVLPPPAPVRKARDRQQVTLSGGVSMAFAWCPPGTFLMGSPVSEEGRCENELQHEVTLTKGFWIGVCPVTQEQWLSVMGSNPSYFPDFTRPVDTVSWQEAIEFCENLKEKMGLGVRLPTEAEWEYAARGGTATPYYWGHDLNGRQANCDGTYPCGVSQMGPYLARTSAVGTYAEGYPHPWGLLDMLGNVWEWCMDWYDAEFFLRCPKYDPVCMDGEKNYLVLRGGCWHDDAKYARAACRSRSGQTRRIRFYGLRVVCPGDS